MPEPVETAPSEFTHCAKADNVCLAELDTLVELLKRSPNAEVQLITNSVESRVAKKIEVYLEKRGVDSNRIVHVVDQDTERVTVMLKQ